MLDNDRTMRELLALALRKHGLEALAAASLEEAEAALGEADGLLLDFHLGGGHSGAQVARRWAEERRLPPFWLVTGVPEEPEVKALCELEGLMGVVGKPFSLLELAERVANTLRMLAQPNGGAFAPSFDEETTYLCSDAQAEPESGLRAEDLSLQRVPTDDHH